MVSKSPRSTRKIQYEVEYHDPKYLYGVHKITITATDLDECRYKIIRRGLFEIKGNMDQEILISSNGRFLGTFFNYNKRHVLNWKPSHSEKIYLVNRSNGTLAVYETGNPFREDVPFYKAVNKIKGRVR